MKRSHKQREKLLRRRRRSHLRTHGDAARPRLMVFRSNRHISAQLIDDHKGATIASASDIGMKAAKTTLKERAAKVGAALAERAKEKGVLQVRFDRSGYRYHGAVAALAEAARAGGLHF